MITKKGLPAPVLAVILIALVSLGTYWGVAVRPDHDALWAKLDAVTVVDGATSREGGIIWKIDGPTATEVLQKIRKASPYIPNHPTTIRSRQVNFSTDQGLITLEITETKDQGCIVGGWPDRRRVEGIARQVFDEAKRQAPAADDSGDEHKGK